METGINTQDNIFLRGSLGLLYAKVATPIILVMLTNGLFTVVDGYFVGEFVGADAFSAVTMVFPLFMMVIALGTLVSSGYASVLARLLGAGRREDSEKAVVSALALSAVICLSLITLFALFGTSVINGIANGSQPLARMGYTYISITIWFSFLFFILALISDSFRCQGMIGSLTIISLLSTLLNILFNYILVVEFQMGVAGTAYGTVMAQALAILGALVYIYSREDSLKFRLRHITACLGRWGEYLLLGITPSLSYVGVSVISASIIFQLQVWNGDTYETSMAAYGIVTRLMTFGYMPLLGLTLAQQSIVGNNFGAGQWDRTLRSLRLSLLLSGTYCILLQLVFLILPGPIADIFVDDAAVILETARILPPVTLTYFLFGPLLMLPGFFQAIGDAGRAGLLGLTKIYFITLPLILGLPAVMGEMGSWYATPVADLVALGLTAVVLGLLTRRSGDWTRFLQTRAALQT
ncbi:MATE family efflux transporter [Sneathiella chinensis]|uniref:MATE family efflux transporter n=1 Tax=Sneathiella chinensis TaxID=349750 RepID=UPI0019CFF872|nr:MATE family efflux transporter [Sneathiella chinensis]